MIQEIVYLQNIALHDSAITQDSFFKEVHISPYFRQISSNNFAKICNILGTAKENPNNIWFYAIFFVPLPTESLKRKLVI
jgi:hypothetical protein